MAIIKDQGNTIYLACQRKIPYGLGIQISTFNTNINIFKTTSMKKQIKFELEDAVKFADGEVQVSGDGNNYTITIENGNEELWNLLLFRPAVQFPSTGGTVRLSNYQHLPGCSMKPDGKIIIKLRTK